MREATQTVRVSPQCPTRSNPSEKSYWKTRLQTAQGLNSVSFPDVGRVYVHSPDDPRARDGEHAGLQDLTQRRSARPARDNEDAAADYTSEL